MVKTERTGFFKWYLTVLIDNYANFSGRARRQEYWMYVLIWSLIGFGLGFIANLLEEFFYVRDWASLIIGIYALGTLIPWLAVNVRRLHDTGKSGGYFFINFIPFIGRIWYIILVATNGESGANKYGPDPKAPDIIDEIDEIGKPLLDQ